MISVTLFDLINRKHKADIALFCVLLMVSMFVLQVGFSENSNVVYADDDDETLLEFWIRNGKDVIAQAILLKTGEAILKYGPKYLTPSIVMKLGALIIAGGIIATTIVGVVIVVNNIVKEYYIENEVTGCIMSPGGKHWVCPYSVPGPIEKFR